MSEWITDRRPTSEEASPMWLPWARKVVYLVWIGKDGREPVLHDYDRVKIGTPWKSLTPPEPYVKPKRYTVDALRDTISGTTWYEVWDNLQETRVTTCIPTWEAAERIAAIYEEAIL